MMTGDAQSTRFNFFKRGKQPAWNQGWKIQI